MQTFLRSGGLAASIGLATLACWLWRSGEQRLQSDLLATRHARPSDLIAEATFKPAGSVEVDFLRDNALFYSTRSFYQPPPPVQSLPPPDYEFSGSMMPPQGKRVAFLRNKTDRASRMVHVGDELDGWQVSDVTVNRIVLTRGDQHLEIGGGDSNAPSGLTRISAATMPAPARGGQRTLGSGLHAGLRTDTQAATGLVPRFYQAPP